MTTSPNLGLTLTPSTEATKNFLNWRTEMAGDSVDSNMMILDTEVGTVKNNITNLTTNMPTTTSDLTNDSNFVADASYVHTDANYTTAEKTKLFNIANYANNYSLPAATASVLGGVKPSTGLTVLNGVLSVTVPTTNDYTTTEKTKLAGINITDRKTWDISLTTTWSGTSAPYTQTVTVAGLLSTDDVHITPIYNTTNATAILEKTAWNYISKVTPSANTLTFTCFETKPIQSLSLHLEVLR